MKKEFYSNGKLLITGEYLVLDGAKALALPTKFGQYLDVESNSEKIIYWKSYDADGSLWFETVLTFAEIINNEIAESSHSVKNTLIEILHVAYQLNPSFLENSGHIISTRLTFPKNWGLGTSSTLINNIAQWLSIDAFELLHKSFGGSGYDIACAQNNFPIIYQIVNGKPMVNQVSFNPEFKDSIYFLYLNRKQNSKTAIQLYYNKRGNVVNQITNIDALTQTIIYSKDIETFAKVLQEHENEMSKILELQTIKEVLFDDFDGIVKSLGAWNGDFVMVVCKENPTSYFKKKGFETILTYGDMIL
jgi:mevalonate kinase